MHRCALVPGARQYIVGIQSSITIICVDGSVSHDNTGPIAEECCLMEWIQGYDPLHHAWLSTTEAARRSYCCSSRWALFEWKAHWRR